MALTGRIGEHYEIVTLLGSGAMGEVYRAIDRKMFDRTVAIKFLTERLTANEEGRLRFRREIETSARLHHPNIVTIYDWGEHLSRDYFVMEFVDGSDLQRLLDTSVSWNLEQRLDVAFQVADALDFAHRAGVIHRDIKPGNIMVVASPSGPRVKLVDFGIAHVERSKLTQAASGPGTFAYMSPEQLRGDATDPLDPRRDLFSLGIVLSELFTGHHPFAANSEALIVNRILQGEPDPPSRHGTDVPPLLDSLILRMVAREPGRRPSSAREVADALREIARQAVLFAGASDPTITGLDELERQLVGGVLAWAQQREAEGAVEDALAAYDRAARLAPDSARIKQKIADLAQRSEKLRELDVELRELTRHLEGGRVTQARASLRKAWTLGPDDPRVTAFESQVAALEDLTPEARERKEFIAARMKDVNAALDAGKIEESLTLLSQILRRYPDHSDAAVMLDRLVDVAAGKIAYADYRAAIRDAASALQKGNVEEAATSQARATVLWPEGPEAEALAAQIAVVRHETRLRAEELRDAQAREADERVRRQHEILERYMDGARRLLTTARAIDPVAPNETRKAIEAFGRAVAAVGLVLTDRPDHPGARELRKEVLDEIAVLEKALPEQQLQMQSPRAPQPPLATRPRSARRVTVIAVVVIALAIGAIAIWKLRPKGTDPLALPESTAEELVYKQKLVHLANERLLADGKSDTNLEQQELRLQNLVLMTTYVDRMRKAPTRDNAEQMLRYLKDVRSKLAPEDATAKRIESEAESLLETISP